MEKKKKHFEKKRGKNNLKKERESKEIKYSNLMKEKKEIFKKERNADRN